MQYARTKQTLTDTAEGYPMQKTSALLQKIAGYNYSVDYTKSIEYNKGMQKTYQLMALQDALEKQAGIWGDIGHLVGNGVGAAKGAWNWAKDTAGQAWEGAKQMGRGAVDTVKGWGRDAADYVSSGIDDFKREYNAGQQNYQQDAQTYWNNAKDLANKGISTIRETYNKYAPMVQTGGFGLPSGQASQQQQAPASPAQGNQAPQQPAYTFPPLGGVGYPFASGSKFQMPQGLGNFHPQFNLHDYFQMGMAKSSSALPKLAGMVKRGEDLDPRVAALPLNQVQTILTMSNGAQPIRYTPPSQTMPAFNIPFAIGTAGGGGGK